MRTLLIAVAALLSSCSTLPAPISPSPHESWLVGGWIPVGAHCESDAGVGFRLDGTWVAYEAAGTWTLDEQTLITLTTDRWESGGDFYEVLAQPQRNKERIEVTGADSYRAYRANGEIVEMRRCPPVD